MSRPDRQADERKQRADGVEDTDRSVHDIALVRINTTTGCVANYTVSAYTEVRGERHELTELAGLAADKWYELTARLRSSALVLIRAPHSSAHWAGETDGWGVLGVLEKVGQRAAKVKADRAAEAAKMAGETVAGKVVAMASKVAGAVGAAAATAAKEMRW